MVTRQGIMLCHPFTERRFKRWNSNYFIQPKFKGERGRVVIDEDGVVRLFSSSAKPVTGVPHIIKAYQKIATKFRITKVELDGELYCHGMSQNEIRSIVSRQKNTHPNHDVIEHHLYDWVSDESQVVRLAKLESFYRNFLSSCPYFALSPWTEHNHLDELWPILEHYIDLGYEGVVLRHYNGVHERKRSHWIMKLKPREEDVYEIVKVLQEYDIHGQPKESCGALLLKDEDGHEFKVGSGQFLTREMRYNLWIARDRVPGMFALITYENITEGGGAKGVPYSAVLKDVGTGVMKQEHDRKESEQ